MARADRQSEIARAVAQAFMAAGFSASDLLTGAIAITDLEWRCPPLASEELLGGYPLRDYLDYSIGIDGRQLYRFWKQGLHGLWVSPTLVATAQGWKNTGNLARTAAQGERNLRFSVPEDFPNHNPLAGAVFTLEVTHAFVTNCKVMSELTSDGSNYWVSTEYGDVGIRDGAIIGDTNWNEPMNNLVTIYLDAGRGFPVTTCRYDLLAKVRSVLYEYPSLFEEFVGLDWALQALACISQDRLCAPLLSAIQSILPDTYDAKRKIKILDEAIQMMGEWVANDRVKISSLYETLVPAIYNIGSFYRHIYNIGARQVPAIMRDGTLKKISETLEAKRESILQTLGPRDREALKRDDA